MLLQVGDVAPISLPPAIEETILIGTDGDADPSGLLRGLLGGRDGWILVRPDAHVAWARCEASGIHQAIDQAVGYQKGLALPQRDVADP